MKNQKKQEPHDDAPDMAMPGKGLFDVHQPKGRSHQDDGGQQVKESDTGHHRISILEFPMRQTQRARQPLPVR